MIFLDILILVVIAIFVFKGLKLGLIEAIGGIVGIILGIILANNYYPGVADWLAGIIKNTTVASVGGYILVFIVINRLVAFIFYIINKMFDVIAIVPFLKTFNHLLGGIFGFIEGVLVVGIVLFVITILPFGQKLLPPDTTSKFAPTLINIGSVVEPYIPDSLKQMEIPWPSGLNLPSLDLQQLPINSDTLNNLGGQVKNIINQVPKGTN